eukprot:1161677-Pelagomonas_calceolata.AAC.1
MALMAEQAIQVGQLRHIDSWHNLNDAGSGAHIGLFTCRCAHDDEETMQAKMAQMGSDGLPLRKTQNAGSKQTVAQLKVR